MCLGLRRTSYGDEGDCRDGRKTQRRLKEGRLLLEKLEKANHSEKEKFAKDFNQGDKSNQIKKEKAQR